MKKIVFLLMFAFLTVNVALGQILHNVGGTTVKAEMKYIKESGGKPTLYIYFRYNNFAVDGVIPEKLIMQDAHYIEYITADGDKHVKLLMNKDPNEWVRFYCTEMNVEEYIKTDIFNFKYKGKDIDDGEVCNFILEQDEDDSTMLFAVFRKGDTVRLFKTPGNFFLAQKYYSLH